MNKLTKSIKGVTNKLPKMKASNFTRSLGKAQLNVQKHSPLILAVVGGAGLVATAVLAYKAQPRVAEIVEDLEEARALEARYLELKQVGTARMTDAEVVELVEMERDGVDRVDNLLVLRDLAGAVALPVAVGVASLTAMLFSYKILSGRVTSLTAAVTSLTMEKIRQDQLLKAELSQEDYNRVTRPTTTQKIETVDEKGKKKVVEGEVKQVERTTGGVWFSDSDEFVSDDHAYNMAWIDNAEKKLDTVLSRRGYLLLNQVFDALGVERTPEGAILGWSLGDSFSFGVDICDTIDRHGSWYSEIYVKWPAPKPIYEDVDFDGRYSVIGE